MYMPTFFICFVCWLLEINGSIFNYSRAVLDSGANIHLQFLNCKLLLQGLWCHPKLLASSTKDATFFHIFTLYAFNKDKCTIGVIS